MTRAAEFAHLAAAALTPGYRRLWTSQAEYYAGQGNGQPGTETPTDGTQANVGNSEATPAFRLANESAWAALFDALGVAWEYNARFWLPDRGAWVEVKEAAPTVGEFTAARALAGGGCRVYMVTGWPARKRFGVWVLATEGEAMIVRSDYCDLALCNLFDCSFERLYQAFDEVKQ